MDVYVCHNNYICSTMHLRCKTSQISHELDAPNVFPLMYVLWALFSGQSLLEFAVYMFSSLCSLASVFFGFHVVGCSMFPKDGYPHTTEHNNLNKHQRQVTCRMRIRRRKKQYVWFQERTVILIRNEINVSFFLAATGDRGWLNICFIFHSYHSC